MLTTGRLLLLTAVVVPSVAALMVAAVRSDADRAGRWATTAMAVAVAASIGLVIATATGPVDAVVSSADGGVVVGWYADRVGAVLTLLSTGVGLVVQSFAARALTGDPRAGRFFSLALLLAGSTTAVATAATAVGTAVAWVVVGLTISALIGHRAEWRPAANAAARTRRSFLLGDAALVAAVVLLVSTVGDLDLRDPAAAAAVADERIGPAGATVGLGAVVGLLLVVAGISRSALVPLHRWLPSTVAAPTPVSALLHAGVVNGAGVLLIRFAPVFGSSWPATAVAFAAGLATAVLATAVMLVRADVKGGLAWSTAGQMGFMVVQCAVGAFGAAVFHVVGHGLYKAALFLGAGGAITAHARHGRRPGPCAAVPPVVGRAIAVLLPAAAIAIVYPLVDPPLPTAGTILVVVFAWATASRAVTAWLRAAPFSPPVAAAAAAVGTLVGVFGYLGMLAAFEHWVYDAVPHDLPGTVGPAVLGVALAVVGTAGGLLWWTPGPRGQRRRRQAYAALLSTGAPPLTASRPRGAADAPQPAYAPARTTTVTGGEAQP